MVKKYRLYLGGLKYNSNETAEVQRINNKASNQDYTNEGLSYYIDYKDFDQFFIKNGLKNTMEQTVKLLIIRTN